MFAASLLSLAVAVSNGHQASRSNDASLAALSMNLGVTNAAWFATLARDSAPGDDTSLASFGDPAAAVVLARDRFRGDEWASAPPRSEAQLAREAYAERFEEAKSASRLAEVRSEARAEPKFRGSGDDDDREHGEDEQGMRRGQEGEAGIDPRPGHFGRADLHRGSGPLEQGYELVYLEREKFPEAVCNDGTPGAFFIQQGSPHRWVVYMQGGRWCYDSHSCEQRWNHYSHARTSFLKKGEVASLMSTANLTKLTSLHNTFNGELNNGVLSRNQTENPDLHNATKVFVVYCSSDAFAGNVSREHGSRRLHFRGKEILRSVVATLAAKWELGKANVFLLTGSSSGGMATIANADFVSGLVRRAAHPRSLRFVASPDSGFFLDVNPSAARSGGSVKAADALRRSLFFDLEAKGGIFPGFAEQLQQMIVFTGGVPDETCSRFYAKEHERWRCYLGQYASKFFDNTVLLVQSQLDGMQLQYDGFKDFKKKGSADEESALRFRASAIQELTQAAKHNPYVHVFAPACFHHVLTTSKTWWDVRVRHKSARDVLGSLLSGAPAPSLLIDECEGVACSVGCQGVR